MYKFLKSLFYLFLIVLAFSGCRKAALDAFYGRPATLAPPIYQTLQAAGNFTNMLTCIDKAGYTNILSTGGYWTLFAADDAAFAKANINASTLDAATATKIVSYSLIGSGYTSSLPANGLVGGSIELSQYNGGAAFKRRTLYHDGIDTATVPNNTVFGTLAGQNILVTNQNTTFLTPSVLSAGISLLYDPKDFNNKYIPYYSPIYLQYYGLTSLDYTTFYPNSTFTNSSVNFNVLDGNVVNGNIICENGVVQEINTVAAPLPNLEKYLRSNPNYSHFYNLMQQYGNLVSYGLSPDATHVNQVLTGSSASVYVKQYSSSLAFSPQNENLVSPGSTYPQSYNYTFMAPTNAAFDAYVNNVLLEHYPSLATLPPSVIIDFINAHMSKNPIWPSQIATAQASSNPAGTLLNFNNEPFRFSISSNLVDAKMCSNGMFYGTNKVQATNVFSTVYGRVYLDPNYSIMARVLSFFLTYKINLSNPAIKYTMIIYPDATLKALGYSLTTSAYSGNPPTSGITFNGNQSATIDGQLERLINLGIFTTYNHELDDITGNTLTGNTGIYATTGLTSGSEVVKFSNNQFFAAGNQDAGNTVAIDPTQTKVTTNGVVYYAASNNTNILSPTPIVTSSGAAINTEGNDIFNKGQIAPVNGIGGDPYYMFYKFLSNSTLLWNAAAKSITGVDIGTNYTIFIPTNQAMQDAVNNGWLPGIGTGAVKTPNFAPSSASDIALVTNFIKYHILKGKIVIPDGTTGSTNSITELFSNDGNSVLLTTNNIAQNKMQVIDGQLRIANVLPANTITLCDHAVILSIDTYLQYIDSTALTPNNPTPNKY